MNTYKIKKGNRHIATVSAWWSPDFVVIGKYDPMTGKELDLPTVIRETIKFNMEGVLQGDAFTCEEDDKKYTVTLQTD